MIKEDFINLFTLYFFVYLTFNKNAFAQFTMHETDRFDEINTLFYKVNSENCMIKPKPDLFLPEDTVSHLPEIEFVNVNPIFPNRTALYNIHNLALSRAFFFSYILQTRFKRPPVNASENASEYDPGFMYYFLSAAADVASNPRLNSSAVYFQPHMAYTSSYKSFFNNTMPLFAPRAFRMDDYNDPVHLERISTMNFIQIDDLGAIPPKGMKSHNYTLEDYRINEWYYTWLPHRNQKQDGITTYQDLILDQNIWILGQNRMMYRMDEGDNPRIIRLANQVKIRYANNTNETYMFHGPNAPDEKVKPVKFSRPYFDCGRSNKWMVPAASPVADLYPRHTMFRHIEYPTFTAVTVMEMDFERIDINQCPWSKGNDKPNRFVDTARCKKKTTECEPIDGYGFRRGGYQCPCKLQHRLPNMVRRPYLGEIIERATSYQYNELFDCEPIQLIHKMPLNYEKMEPVPRYQYMSKYYHNVTGVNATRAPYLNTDAFLDYIKAVTPTNCHRFPPEDLILRGDIAFGNNLHYENEARAALRLANFISAFSQIVLQDEIFSGVRVVDRPLTEDQMMGEVLSAMYGNSRIWSAGVYWDRNKFTDRVLFAPLAYKEKLNDRNFLMEDLARLNTSREVYTNKAWFRRMKRRWSTNFDDLDKYYIKLKLRQNSEGMFPIKYEHYPTFYRAAEMRHGEWSGPEFDCTGPVKKWLIRYSAPFFGWDALRAKLEFKGMVTTSMDLSKMDMNQCPGNYYDQNAFKDSHRCDKKTSYCVPIQGREFTTGGYKCECIQGYEYPYNDQYTYFDGQIVEAEFENIINDQKTRYDYLKCRLAGVGTVESSIFIMLILMFLLKVLNS